MFFVLIPLRLQSLRSCVAQEFHQTSPHGRQLLEISSRALGEVILEQSCRLNCTMPLHALSGRDIVKVMMDGWKEIGDFQAENKAWIDHSRQVC